MAGRSRVTGSRVMHPQEAFELKVEPTSGCWWWRGPIATSGYGQFPWDGRREYAHRIAWMLWNGHASIPKGLVIRHTCDTPLCVSPYHLLIGTKADNSRDMVERGRSTRKAICKRGHPLTAENRYPLNGNCIPCARLRAAAHSTRSRA